MSRWHTAIVAAVAVAVYANTFGHGYVLDDALVITRNEFVQAGWAGIPDLVTGDSMRGYLQGRDDPAVGGRYRPLSLVTFAIETALFGSGPFAHHAIHVLLYALCCAVLYRVFVALIGGRASGSDSPWLSLPFAAALLFTVHPLHSEVVANLKSRDELLALLSLASCLRAAGTARRGPAIAAALLFFLALVSKESALMFLAVAPLSLWFFREDFRTAAARVMPGLGIAAFAYLALRQINVSYQPAPPELLNNPFLGASTADAYATIFYTLGRYVELVLWPHPLTYDYWPYHVAILSWRDAGAWLGLALQIGLLVLALSGIRTRSIPAYAAAFYLTTLFVTSNLVIPAGPFMGERFLFSPSAGAALGLAWALLCTVERLPASRRVPVASATVLIVATALGSLTLLRNRAWKDNYTLFTTDISVSAESALANANLADVQLSRAGETADPAERARLEAEAVAHLETALRIHPRYERAFAMLATVQERRGDADAAFATLERLFAVNPRHGRVAFNLGTLILEHHPERGAEAVPYLEHAVELAPRDADVHANLGVAYYLSGDPVRAIASLERAVALAPENAGHRANLEALRAEAAAADPR